MYSREEASQLRQEFWTRFGQYLSPCRSAEGLKVNWLNYKTGIKNLYFRMNATQKTASISIDITHPDAGIRELFFEQFLEFRGILKNYLGEDWEWELNTNDENGKALSRISKEIRPVNVFDQGDWPAIISFFKPRIIGLDEFWSDIKYHFDALK